MPSIHSEASNGAAKRASSQSKSRAKTAKGPDKDAIALLKADHRAVEDLFEQFEKTKSDSKKQKLATQICAALKVHTQIEEELFYPACREAGVDMSDLDEAYVEHAAAKDLIAQIEEESPGDEYYDAKVKVLSEQIKHHVKDEEERGGLFAEAKQAGIDMKTIGAQLQARKDELTKGSNERR